MIISNNTKLLLRTFICKFENFIVNHYYQFNYLNNLTNHYDECSNYLKNSIKFTLEIFNNTISDNIISDNTIFNNTIFNNTIFNNTISDNIVSNNIVSNNIVSDNIVSDNIVSNNIVSNNIVNNNTISDIYFYFLEILDYKTIINYNATMYNNYSFYYNLLLSIIAIFMIDYLLIFLFGSKGRWYQLHAFSNLLIVIYILPEIKNIIYYNYYNNNYIENNIPSLFILVLHLYHVLAFKNLYLIDYIHHIFFVGFGLVPSMIFLKSNQSFLAFLPSMGIPGIIEYTTLTLYKNNYITLLKQKKLISFVYNYFRYPLCIFGLTFNYINYKNGYLIDNYYLTIYLNFLLFLNGSIFNYLTLNSYFNYKYNKKSIIKLNYSTKNK